MTQNERTVITGNALSHTSWGSLLAPFTMQLHPVANESLTVDPSTVGISQIVSVR
jgi:hypothetical protein